MTFRCKLGASAYRIYQRREIAIGFKGIVQPKMIFYPLGTERLLLDE